MEMTIDEAIATIKGEKWIGCQEKYIEAINLMKNTMRKYQKIEQIMDNRADDSPKSNSKALSDIEVIIYGDND